MDIVTRLRALVALSKAMDETEGEGVQFAPCLDEMHTDDIEEAATLIEALTAALRALSILAEHVAVGGCIPSMNIHGSAKELFPLVEAAEAALSLTTPQEKP